MGLRRIGTWISSLQDDRRPAPQELVAVLDPDSQERVAAYLDAAPLVSHYQIFGAGRMVADCLFEGCSFSIGESDRSDGAWIWTDDLSHYVRHHGVRLPSEFTDLALVARESPRELAPVDGAGEEDSYWLAWCSENRSPEFPKALRKARLEADEIASAELAEHTAWLVEDGERRLGVSGARCQWYGCERSALLGRVFCGLHLMPWPVRPPRELEIYNVRPLLHSFFRPRANQ